MKTIAVASALLASLAVGLCFAQRSDRIIEFNDAIVGRLVSSEKPFEAYWKAVEPWYSGEKANPKEVSAALVVLEETHRRIYDELLEFEVPSGKLCKEFYDVVLDYFEIDREVIAALNLATEYILEHNPATGKEDIDHIDGLIDPILERQEALFEQVLVLQRKMAKKYDFALE